MRDSTWPNLGIYRHYKGGYYQVLGVALDSNADELFSQDKYTGEYYAEDGRLVVVYSSLYLAAGPRLAVRTVEDWNARLHLVTMDICPDTEHCSYRFPRFRFVGHDGDPEKLHRINTGQPSELEFAQWAERRTDERLRT